VQITKAYITSRLESVESVLRDNLENPLDDKPMVAQQLDQMSVIGRFVNSIKLEFISAMILQGLIFLLIVHLQFIARES
jgi:hypothetical protein